jgi:DNA-binding CsgD family transcriptional regulator
MDMMKKVHPIEFTKNERRVLTCIRDGLTYPEMAAKLVIKLETVRYYVKRIREKTGISRKPQLAVWASRKRHLIGVKR